LSPSSKDSAIDLYESDRRLSEEIDYLVSQRAAEIVKKSYERDRVEFQQICNTFSTVNCMENVQHVFNHKIDELKTSIEIQNEKAGQVEIENLRKEIEFLKTKNLQLKSESEDLKMREVALKGLTPNQDLVNRYRSALDKLTEKNCMLDSKVSQLQMSNQQLVVAYNQSEARCRVISEDLNEESRKREFAERRSNELYKLLQRAEVGIGIDRRKALG